MKSRAVVPAVIILLFVTATSVFAQAPAPSDRKGCSDPQLFPTRIPGYEIAECDTKEYDAYDLYQLKGPKVSVEGRKVFVSYVWAGTKSHHPPTVSALEIIRNYENAFTKIGGTVANILPTGTSPYMNGKLVKDGKEVWVQIVPRGGSNYYWVTVVEKKGMEQKVVADAAAFGNDLTNTGHTSVYGIYFDTGKAELKPESGPALDEVTKLLNNDPKLKLWVVGHTDWVGKVEDNMTLSQARADAVVKALVGKGIAAARLRAFGSGPLAPVASNDGEDGRAKNRRVELVKQP